MSNIALKNVLALRNAKTPLTQFKTAWSQVATDLQVPQEHLETMEDLDNVGNATQVGKCYNHVVNCLNALHIGANGMLDNRFVSAGSEALKLTPMDSDTLEASIPTLQNLCEQCGVPKDKLDATMRNLAACLLRYTNGNVMTDHFQQAPTTGYEGYRSLSTIYPAGITSDATYNGTMLGREAFGVNSSQLLPDLKVAMTITLLKSYKGVTSRIMHRAPNETGAVQYIVPNDEFYDLAKSQNSSGDVRQSWEHRNNIVRLYQYPEPVDMNLIPVVPQKANDVDDKFLVADDVLKTGVEINLWDMAIVPNRVGYDKFTYTDLLSNRMNIRGVHVTVTMQGGASEQFYLSTKDFPSAILNKMPTTMHDAGDHAANLIAKFPFDKDTLTSTNVANTIFAGYNVAKEYIMMSLHFTAKANTMSAIVHGMGSVDVKACSSVAGVAPSEEAIALVDKLTVTIDGWVIDACYSEENYRKTNMAVRSMVDIYTYTLPDGRTIVADHSMQQSLPEHVMAIANEVQTIGIDHRNLQMITKTLRSIHDRVLREHTDQQYISNFGGLTVNKAFVSGKRVNPEVALHTLDLDNVKIFQSSDMLSDIREYVRAYVMNVISRIHYRSLYLQALDQQDPVYKVITTTPIIECLFGLPSIHPQFMKDGMSGEGVFETKTPGKPVEFSCVLPSGVRLEFVSTAFHYMDNQIVIIPFRPNDVSSDLNFMVNHDGGQFSVNFTPVDGNAVNRRSMENTREYPIALCPIGAIITVTNMVKKFPDLRFDLM